MNHQIPILHGFIQIWFGDRAVPTEAMLMEMLCLGVDVNNAELLVTKHPTNLDSQLVLQSASNRILSGLDENLALMPICKKLSPSFKDAHFNIARYHLAVLEYIDALFMPNPDTEDLISVNVKLKKAAYKAKEDGVDLEATEDIGVASVPFEEVKEKLRSRFPDYRIADNYMTLFDLLAGHHAPQEFLVFFDKRMSEASSIREKRLANYRLPKAERIQGYQRTRQCPYCHNWYEHPSGGNGRLRAHCGELSCKRAWDRNRKKGENL